MKRELQNMEDERIAELLGSLKRVETPSDFDVKVRSLIAFAEPKARFGSAELLLALKFAVPAIFLALFGAFLVFSGSNGIDLSSVPPIDDKPVSAAQIDDLDKDTGLKGNLNKGDVALTASDTNSNLQKDKRITLRDDRLEGGSKDSASGHAENPILPDGLNPKAKVEDLRGISPTGVGVSIREILTFIGVLSDCDPAGCKVVSVSANSMADRSGLRSGDRIEAIDGRPINGSTVFKNAANVKTILVARNGKRTTISLIVR